ncbi:NifU family protein [Cryobacterium sp. SO2]|uniref:NifU family protein n=1 Tax=Cryobacterium sp. SO2 TaxID=1897060 RepID=UPI00223CCC60|nr:NifU family protein [Cryobacterium sp. SO2]WEO78761.1 NifU family protein [Cryobacterium sp. SO2]
MIPTHPEAVVGQPDTLRWVLPAGILAVGEVRAAPGALGTLLRTGVVRRMRVDRTGVLIRLEPDASWPAQGAAVRAALHSALEQPGAWTLASCAPPRSADDRLHEAAEAVLAGAAGDFIRSHGGTVELILARDDVATVRLRGACAGCPAVGFTLQARVERDLRLLYPELRAVRAG